MTGALCSTFTSAQGLLLMIPTLHRVSGGMLPAVFHVASRIVGAQALSIYNDHSDVMTARTTNICQLVSNGPQECMDLGLVAHLASIKSNLPFMHFFDGFRTSHEVNTVDAIPYSEMYKLLDKEALRTFRRGSLHPENPHIRGTVLDGTFTFQTVEAANTKQDAVVPIVEHYMNEVGKLTGRYYKPYQYYGHP